MQGAPIDQEKLAISVRTRRAEMSLRDAADESGIAHNVIKRVEHQESVPDLKNFIGLCRWMRMPMDFFVLPAEGESASEAKPDRRRAEHRAAA